MRQEDEAILIRPDGLVERLGGGYADPPASYAPAVARLRRGQTVAPPDRRARPRLPGEPSRGRLVDSRR
jgi:hypothetical protein